MTSRNMLQIHILNQGTVHISSSAWSDTGQDLTSSVEIAAEAVGVGQTAAGAPAIKVPRFLHEPSSAIVIDRDRNLMWSARPLSTERKKFAAAVEACAACRLGEHSDWRLPTREELQSLVDYTRYNPAIDVDVFPNTPSSYFWSSSPAASDPVYAWVVDFYHGYVALLHRGSHAFVRAVRSVPASQ